MMTPQMEGPKMPFNAGSMVLFTGHCDRGATPVGGGQPLEVIGCEYSPWSMQWYVTARLTGPDATRKAGEVVTLYARDLEPAATDGA